MKYILHIFVITFLFSLFYQLEARDNAEDKTETKTSIINYISGSDSVEAFLAVPEGDGPFPAFIVIHEWWGLTDWIKDNAERFADSGYIALAIDLYRGKSTSDAGEAHELSRGLPEDRAIRDLKAAFNHLQKIDNIAKDKIGSIGWCMGGGYSLQAALNIEQLQAAVICYGRLVTDEELISRINCSILGIFGKEDRGISEASVKELEQSLNRADIKNKINVYSNVGHAFMNPNNDKGYNKEIAVKAWEEIFTFLSDNLK